MEIREHNGHRYRLWAVNGEHDDAIKAYIDQVLNGTMDSETFMRDVSPNLEGHNVLAFRLNVTGWQGLPLFIENDPSYKSFNCFGHTVGPSFAKLATVERDVSPPEGFMSLTSGLPDDFADLMRGFFISHAGEDEAEIGDVAAMIAGGDLMSSESRDWNSERIGIPAQYYQFPSTLGDWYGGAVFDDVIVEDIAKLVDAWDAKLAQQFRSMFGSKGSVAANLAQSQQDTDDWTKKHEAELAECLSRPLPDNDFDPTKVYLITCSGQGDTYRSLVNHETYYYVIHGGDAPEYQVQLMHEDSEPGTTVEEVRKSMREMVTGGSPDNDRALAVAGDLFGGEMFDSLRGSGDDSTKGLVKFLKKHNLELSDDEYEGYIY